MLQLDVRSIVFINFVYTSVIALFLLFFGHRSFKRLPGLRWWTYAFLMFTLGYLIISLRGLFPPGLSDVLPHLLMLAGFYVLKTGLSRFFEVPNRTWLDGVFLAAGFILLVLFAGRNLSARITVIAGSVMVSLVLTLAIIRDRDAVTLRIIFGLAIVIQAVRIILSWYTPADVDPMKAGTVLAVVSILGFFSQVLIALSLVSATVRRLLSDRDELLEREQHNSITDELTGLMNRRGFRTVYEREEKRAIRKKDDMSLVIADVDGFKEINDTYGHDCGDEVLRYVAEVFRREFRGGDILVRWGGEEFLIVQPETDQVACRTSLERTRQAVAREPFKRDGEVFYVTMSFGYHTATAGDMGFQEQLKKADDSMYAAKKGGKNRVMGSASA